MEQGCAIYDFVYPVETGGRTLISNLPIFANTNRIAIRYYQQDPKCGIEQSKLQFLYGNQCFVNNGGFLSNYGTLVNYNAQDNSCVQNIPLDGWGWVLVGIGAFLGFYMIKKYLS